MSFAIETKGLGMVFRTDWAGKKRALENLNIQVQANEIYGFLGHNGAGKTTTIKILSGICHATEGSANIFGVPVNKIHSRTKIGFLPENLYFYEYLTAEESLEFYGRLHGLSSREARSRITEILEDVGLRDVGKNQIREFSKGMKQRLGVGQAMIHDPDLYILDEPLSGLDPMGRREIRDKILFLKEKGKTVFFSSHVLADVEMICDEVTLLSKGQVVSSGKLEDLLLNKVTSAKLVATSLSAQVIETLTKMKVSIVEKSGETNIHLETEEDANKAKEIIESGGGKLRELILHRDNLEDYYIRQVKGEHHESANNSSK